MQAHGGKYDRRVVGAAPHRRACARGLLAAALLGALGPGARPAAAQDAGGGAPPADLASLPLDQLLQMEVSSASRFDQRAAQAPSAVQVITAEQIRRHGWRTLGEALESLPGLYLSDSGLYTYLGARGLLRAGDYDTRFLLLVDGHRINDPVYSQSPVGAEFPLDMALVERIEYVPGPGSALYGSNAFFGVINVKTRAPGEGGELALRGGNHGTRGARASLSLHGPLGDSLLSASEVRSDGRDLYVREFVSETSDGIARGLDAERARRLLLRHDAGRLRLTLLASERRKDEPVASYEQTFGIPGGDVGDRWVVLGAQYERALGEATRWQAQLDAIDYRYVGNYVYADDPGAPPLRNRDVSSGRTLVLESRVVSTAFDRHTLVAGVEAQFDHGVEQANYDVDPRVVYLRSRHDGHGIGVFASDEYVLGDSWRLNGGLRLDRGDTGALRASPRLALVSAHAEGTTVKAIVGSAFRAPNAYERFYESDTEGGQRANPHLGAERIRTAELFLGRNLGPRTRAELSLYDYALDGLITLVDDGDDRLMMESRDSAASTGAELALRHRWAGGAGVRASYAHARVRDSAEGEAVNAPSGVAKVVADVPLGHGLSLGASAAHMRRRATRGGHVGANTQLHLNLLWEPAALPLSLSAGVRNLLDERYADPVGPEFTQDAVLRRGRETRVELAWRF